MVIPVLVVTPNIGLGELICQILNETGDYAVSLTVKAQSAVQTAEKEKPALVIMETELKDTSAGELLAALREKLPDLLVLLIASEDKTGHASYSGLQPDGLLVKPVYLPDLLTKVEAVVEKSNLNDLKRAEKKLKASRPPFYENEMEEQVPPAPAWLHDVNLAAQHLIRLSLESSAQASLITRGNEIWAYAGELPRPAAEELANAVAIHFEDGGGSDLARFIRLDETGGEYMLYATGLGGEYVLATVFNAETPFSKIRAQANQLADALASAPPPIVEEEPEFILEGEPEEQKVRDLWPMLEDVPPPIPNTWVPESSLQQPESRESLLEELLEGAATDAFSSETIAISKKELEAMPQNNVAVDEFQESQEMQTETETLDEAQPTTVDQQLQIPRPQTPPEAPSEVPLAAETRPSVSKLQHQELDAKPISESEQETQVSQSAQPGLAEPIRVSEQVSLDPVSPSMYNLTYACVLIPRFPNHHLSGEVGKRLSDWINHLTVAFGWRLEQLSVRPEYLQMLVNVPPNTSPGYLMRTIRQHTSRRMFIEFPNMEVDNPSGDFWAPGYLILGNPQPPPPALVQEFIQNTRKRQGLIS